MKRLVILSLVLLCISGCQKNTKRNNQQHTDPEPMPLPAPGKPITIFVHGGAKPWSALIRMPGLYDVCPQGFFLASELHDSSCLGKRIGVMLNDIAPERFPLTSFYVFGWSGLLSPTAREKAGRRLYNFIVNLRSYAACQNVPLTIIGYSHGGNVALAAAQTAWENNDRRTLVDRLIIMACPVVIPTEHYIPSPMFKEVLALYSKSDPFQVSDLQGFYVERNNPRGSTLFSQRRFDQSTRLIQAEVKIDNRSRTGHLGFIARRVLNYLPQIIDMLGDAATRRTLPRDSYCSYCVNINTKFKRVEPCRLRGEYFL